MVSIQSSVIALYRENRELTLFNLKELFPKAASSSLSNALSVARSAFRGYAGEYKIFTKITEEEIEKLIINKLNKSSDNSNVRLAIDFLKIKQGSSGLEVDLDIKKFLKKVKSNSK